MRRNNVPSATKQCNSAMYRQPVVCEAFARLAREDLPALRCRLLKPPEALALGREEMQEWPRLMRQRTPELPEGAKGIRADLPDLVVEWRNALARQGDFCSLEGILDDSVLDALRKESAHLAKEHEDFWCLVLEYGLEPMAAAYPSFTQFALPASLSAILGFVENADNKLTEFYLNFLGFVAKGTEWLLLDDLPVNPPPKNVSIDQNPSLASVLPSANSPSEEILLEKLEAVRRKWPDIALERFELFYQHECEAVPYEVLAARRGLPCKAVIQSSYEVLSKLRERDDDPVEAKLRSAKHSLDEDAIFVFQLRGRENYSLRRVAAMLELELPEVTRGYYKALFHFRGVARDRLQEFLDRLPCALDESIAYELLVRERRPPSTVEELFEGRVDPVKAAMAVVFARCAEAIVPLVGAAYAWATELRWNKELDKRINLENAIRAAVMVDIFGLRIPHVAEELKMADRSVRQGREHVEKLYKKLEEKEKKCPPNANAVAGVRLLCREGPKLALRDEVLRAIARMSNGNGTEKALRTKAGRGVLRGAGLSVDSSESQS